MNRERYNVCKHLLDIGYFTADVEEGVITTVTGSHGSPTNGRIKATAKYEGKWYMFYDYEIIAIAGGLVPIDVTIDHIDNDKTNSKISNLQLLSNADNMHKSAKDGNYRKKLTVADVIELKALHMIGARNIDLVERYEIGSGTVSQIVNNKRNAHIEVQIIGGK